MDTEQVYTAAELRAMAPEELQRVLGTPRPVAQRTHKPVAPPHTSAPPPNITVQLKRLIGWAQTNHGRQRFAQPIDLVLVNGEVLANIGRFADAPLNFLVGGLGEDVRLEVLRQVTEQRAADPLARGMAPRQTLAPPLPAPEELERVFDELEQKHTEEEATGEAPDNGGRDVPPAPGQEIVM